MLVMFVTEAVLNSGKFTKALQVANMLFISVTDEVSKRGTD